MASTIQVVLSHPLGKGYAAAAGLPVQDYNVGDTVTVDSGIGASLIFSGFAKLVGGGGVVTTPVRNFLSELDLKAAIPDKTTQVGAALAAWSSRTVVTPYAATVTPNADTTDVQQIGVLTGALTVAAPSGSPIDGQNLRVRLQQDATGGRVVTWNAAYAFGTDVTAAMVPTTASAKCELLFVWHAGDAKWRAVSLARGF